MKFTDQIAEYIYEQGLDLKHLTIVLPSERAKKYIAASLYRKYGRPVLAPEMITIDRWVRDLSERTVIDKTRALVKLFGIQMEDPSDPKDTSFDEFLAWGNILLSDYDEIDRYQLSSEMVFKNLADIKDLENWEVDNWSFGNPTLTEGQKRFMDFWDRLPGYYRRLNELLDKEGLCYMGQAYRYVSENIDVVFKKDKERRFVFAGFNALSPAETSIIKQLHRMGRGHVLINADKFYLDNNTHEAGRFLRKLMTDLDVRSLPYVEDELRSAEKDIHVIECAQHTGQVKAAATILNGMDQEEIDQTLLLLADESLIAPLLKNLPKKIGKANITLGLPLRDTSLRTWVELIFSIQENKTRFRSEAIYIHDLQKLWNHPFITAILSRDEQIALAQLEQHLIRRNSIFQPVKNLSIGPIPDRILELMAVNWQSEWKTAMSTIREINTVLYASFGEQDAFEKAIVQGFDHSLQDFSNIVQEGLPDMSLKSFKHLFQQHWNTKSIAYHGNPLDGLQIMGLLETRLLDFSKIIVLGLNEGKMPPTNPIQTMIPMDLRAYFGLPTPRDKQGLFAHHFYRLLHHCNEMWVTYTSAQENIGSNEASRYLLQMELELSRVNKGIRIDRQFYSIPDKDVETETVQEVAKTDPILLRLDELFERSVSASAINKYLTCPLDFYYRYVLDFGEEDTVEEEVESNTLGSFIHNVLEILFEPFARHDNKGVLKPKQPMNITSFDVDSMLKQYEMLIHKEFLKHFNDDKSAFDSGKNLLSYKMAMELTRRILEQEKIFLSKQTEKVFIEFIEVEMHADLEIEVGGKKKTIHLKGFMDRVDSVGSKLRIIDYKSGKVKSEDVSMGDIPEDDDLIKFFKTTKHAVQLAFYCYLYQKNYGVLPDEASIYSLVNISEGGFPFSAKNNSLEEVMEEFPRFMEQLFNEIYDTSIPFSHTAGTFWNYCLYCD
jgi:CRISPR/Cas system-associated exonuclease Cas4 (RecB family)